MFDRTDRFPMISQLVALLASLFRPRVAPAYAYARIRTRHPRRR